MKSVRRYNTEHIETQEHGWVHAVSEQPIAPDDFKKLWKGYEILVHQYGTVRPIFAQLVDDVDPLTNAGVEIAQTEHNVFLADPLDFVKNNTREPIYDSPTYLMSNQLFVQTSESFLPKHQSNLDGVLHSAAVQTGLFLAFVTK